MGKLRQCKTKTMLSQLISIVQPKSAEVPYLYCNLLRYGVDTSFVNIWYYIDKDIKYVLLSYYSTMHIYCVEERGAFPKEINDLFVDFSPHTVYLSSKKWEDNKSLFNNFAKNEMYIFKSAKGELSEDVKPLDMSMIPELSEIMLHYPINSNKYSKERLVKELSERYQSGYGTIFSVSSNGTIYSAIAIHAESDRFLMYGCLVCNPEFRGQGYASKVAKHLWKYADEQGKDCIFLVEKTNSESINMHLKNNCTIINTIVKLTIHD